MNARPQSEYPLCRHIKTNGRSCQSPALRPGTLCYYPRYMARSHRPAPRTAPLRPETVKYLLENGQDPAQFASAPALNFPPLEDAESIQIAISVLFAAIVAGHIDSIQARNLLYALQLASFNLRALAAPPAPGDDSAAFVRRTVRTRQGKILAAPGDGNGAPPEAESRISLLAAMLDELIHPHHPTPPDPTTPSATQSE